MENGLRMSLHNQDCCDEAARVFQEVKKYISNPDIAIQVAASALLINGRVDTARTQVAMYFNILNQTNMPEAAAGLTRTLALRQVLRDLDRRS